MRRIDRCIIVLVLFFCLDRTLKLLAVWHFFRRSAPKQPAIWPSVTLLQPITRGVNGLHHTLISRLAVDYPAPMQHLLICDEHDSFNQQICHAVSAAHPLADVHVVIVPAVCGLIASKIEKLHAATPLATGEILVFLDDDVALRRDGLRHMLPYLAEPRAGAVFGLACYTSWCNLWSSAMSGFVNANALLSYIPLTYLAEPWTITGHCFALQRSVYERIGGLADMTNRIDDDHELARRVSAAGLRNLQTPMIYDVNNDLPTLRAYLNQMHRWFMFPRLHMLPQLSRRQQTVLFIGGVGNLLPSVVLLLVLWSRSRRAWAGFAVGLSAFAGGYVWGERRYLGRTTPWQRLAVVLAVAVVAPVQIMWGLLMGDEIMWRGQRLNIKRGGIGEVVQ